MHTRWKWAIGIGVSAVVVVAIVVPCVLLLPEDDVPTEDTRTTYTFEDLYDSKYNYRSLYPTWDKTDPDNKAFITTNIDGNIVRRDVKDHNADVDVLITYEKDTSKSSAYSVSADNKFVFYRNDYKKVWRHSYTANFAIWEIVAGKTGTEKSIAMFPTDGMIHHMEWSPTGHKLAFIHKWDIYVIVDLEAGTPTIIRVTNDGEQNIIYNGIPDWVYEEEMIGANNVLYWSPNSLSFAYLKTNDTYTHTVEYSMYNEAQYPETIEIAYPKAGTSNPTVKMFVYDLGSDESLELAPQKPWPTGAGSGNFSEVYFSRFSWVDDNTCLMTWTDRPQTHSVGNLCSNSSGWECKYDAGTQEYVNNGWVGSFGPFDIVWRDGASNEYFTIYARAGTDPTDGRWQVARISADLTSSTFITNTVYDIVGLNYYDQTNDWLYFTAAAPLPRQRHIYRVKGDATDFKEPECMTCYLRESYENRCGWITPRFNIDHSMVVVNCRGYWIPMTVYIEIAGDGTWGDEVIIENNAQLEEYVGEKKWPKKEYGEFASDDYPDKKYKYEVFLPQDYNPDKQYPLLIEVYAGPEFQSVTDVWTRGWATTHMVSDKDVIVASVDGRGSAFEGYKYMRQIYLKLGQFEPIDQTAFANHMTTVYNIDKTRIGLWGWSYGGYTTSHTLGYDAGNTFKCGIAVAPLADWRFYDSMYAERYMGLPSVNDDGYTKASIITGHDLANFKKSEYVLIHGTSDDNVHFQNAAEMEKALVEADVDFDDFFYADQAHSINSGQHANKHVYRQLTMRMSHCLGIEGAEAYPGKP